MKIDLTSQERQLILDALMHEAYKEKLSDPETPFLVRQIYKALKDKIANAEAESQFKPAAAIAALKGQRSFVLFKKPGESLKKQRKLDEEIVEIDRAIEYLEDL